MGKPYKVLADIIFSDDNRYIYIYIYINSLSHFIEAMISSLCGHKIFLLSMFHLRHVSLQAEETIANMLRVKQIN
jgi:hypothetical protein